METILSVSALLVVVLCLAPLHAWWRARKEKREYERFVRDMNRDA